MENNPLGKIQLEEMKEHQQNKKLVASEIGDLFANYLGDSLFSCVFEHHLQVVEDNEVKEFMEFALHTGKKHIQVIQEIYEKENIPIPVGFGEQDIRKDAPRLFSDIFMVFYITEMARAGLQTYANTLTSSFRQDIIDYFSMCLEDTRITYNKGIHLLLSKGMDIAPPTIPYPKNVDFVEKDSFISVLAGKTRPLTALEIKHLQININTNTLGKAMMLAFSQIASSEELRGYFRRGAQLAEEQIIELGKLLINDNLPTPKLMDAHITDSTVSPFSDKLLLYHGILSNGIGIQNYGTAISKIMRHDIHIQFGTLTASIGKYGNDGLNMMIEKGWLEEPPTAADREKLSKNSTGNQSAE
ncbi:hypothetical protein J2S74_000215 [Evansella vedderi]|uniref:DUF3231 family protein n=1 Tax=Evansella vedderi TaxID=38282 RepID=A0ABT9ZNN1_9BACI|nr:DUF3231 family protein [Evansella vedderi]MDQ0252843.1 hypothetical protein [Evansella vedderi]